MPVVFICHVSYMDLKHVCVHGEAGLCCGAASNSREELSGKKWNPPVRDPPFEMGIKGESRRSLSEADGEQQKEKKGRQTRTFFF